MNTNPSLYESTIVPPDYFDQRVDVVLAQLFPQFSRSQLSQWLKQGDITLNGNRYKPKEKVYGGEVAILDLAHLPTQNEPASCQAEAIPLHIIFEDEHLLIINKQAGLVVHPGAGNPNHTLMNALLHHDPKLHYLPRAGIVHRLDKDTTGLLMVAKTLTTHTHLIRQMQAHQIKRHYWALVQGRVTAGGTVDTFYGRDPRNRIKMAVCAQGRQAITQYTVKARYPAHTLLDVVLQTGRTHQIRVHMAHLDHPIVGDPLYGGRCMRYPAGAPEKLRQALTQWKRQALHAYALFLTHPETNEPLSLTAPCPDDFQALLDAILDKK